jgi:hypothetical protein
MSFQNVEQRAQAFLDDHHQPQIKQSHQRMRHQCHLMHVILLPLKFQLMAKQSLVNILRIQVASMMV